MQLERPQTIRELWHILGLFGYYQSFIKNYSIIAAQLTKLTKGIRLKKKPGEEDT